MEYSAMAKFVRPITVSGGTSLKINEGGIGSLDMPIGPYEPYPQTPKNHG